MSRWRREAFERLPSLRRLLQQEKGPYGFLIELEMELCLAYGRNDEELIRSIYAFTRWCLEQPQGKSAADDLPTAVCVCFFEHLPEHEVIRKDLSRHFSRAFLVGMREVFCYHGTDSQFDEIVQG